MSSFYSEVSFQLTAILVPHWFYFGFVDLAFQNKGFTLLDNGVLERLENANWF